MDIKKNGFLIFIIGLLAISCSKDNKSGVLANSDTLLGRWDLTSYSTSGTVVISSPLLPQDSTENFDSTGTFPPDSYIDFKGDSTFEANNIPDFAAIIEDIIGGGVALQPRPPETGTWVITGGTLYLVPDGQTDSLELSATIDGNAIRFAGAVDSSLTYFGADIDIHADYTFAGVRAPGL